MLVSAKEMLTKAKEGKYAVGQFNINNLEWTKAILQTAQENNSPVWEDSCVEFFVQIPGEKYYYNFEFNCIGTALAARRTGREDAEHFSADKMAKIKRIPKGGALENIGFMQITLISGGFKNVKPHL